MKPQTFIFIGKSGCGKGTQAALLRQYLEKKMREENDVLPILDFQTGEKFREFAKNPNNYSSKLSKQLLETGERQPDFLAIWIWSGLLVDNIKGNEHVLIDGFPRSLTEAKILDIALQFYKKVPAMIFYLKLSSDSTTNRLLLRNRHDDHRDAIKKRIDFFEKDVMPIIEYYRNSKIHNFIEIDGEPEIEKIHENIVREVNARMQHTNPHTNPLY